MNHGMKTRTIEKVLNKKFGEFVESIDDPSVRALVERDAIITGGCIASMLIGENVNDFDVYFKTKETVVAIANYYISAFGNKDILLITESSPTLGKRLAPGQVKIYVPSSGVTEKANPTEDEYSANEDVEPDETVKTDERPPFSPVFMTSNAISLSCGVQIVVRFYGEPDEIHGNYDFVHCTNYWTSKDQKLVLRQAALEALLARELNYIGSMYPVCSMFRLRKFIGRGWRINAGQMLKISLQISQLNLTDINVLEDQLIGVDYSYFARFLEDFNEKFPDGVVPTSYVYEVVERVFG